MNEHLDEDLVDDGESEIVHWMDSKRGGVGAGAASAAAVGGFALGVVATLAALALARYFEDDEHEVVFRRR